MTLRMSHIHDHLLSATENSISTFLSNRRNGHEIHRSTLRTHRESSTIHAFLFSTFPWNRVCDLPVISLLLVYSVSRELLLQKACFLSLLMFLLWVEDLFLSHSRVSEPVMHVWMSDSVLFSQSKHNGVAIHQISPCAWLQKEVNARSNLASSPWQQISLQLKETRFVNMTKSRRDWSFQNAAQTASHSALNCPENYLNFFKALHCINISYLGGYCEN